MKNLLIVGVIAAVAWYFYTESQSVPGAYADDGQPKTLLFTTDQCGQSCVETRRFLKRRGEFEEYDAFENILGQQMYKTYGGTGYLPYVVIGEQRVIGHQPGNIISALAMEFGPEHIKPNERKALQRHFDRDGEPMVVMYATTWCGYCTKARRYFVDNGIRYVEYDIEKDRAARRDYDALKGSGTPLVYNGYARVAGYDEKRYEDELGL